MVKRSERIGSKYKVVVDDIYEKIRNGFYKRGDRLPSEHILVDEYGFSRQTIRHSLEILESQGILDRKRGRGTYIVGINANRVRTHNVGLILTSAKHSSSSTIASIEDFAFKNGYNVVLGVTNGKTETEARLLKNFIEKNIDGIIVQGAKSSFSCANKNIYELLEARKIPVVFINNYFDEIDEAVFVGSDDYKGAYDLTTYLILKGCDKIGAILKSDDMMGQRRYSGYCGSLSSHAIKLEENNIIWYATGDEPKLEKEESIKFFMKSFKSCDGIICQNDRIAAHVIKTMLSQGLTVPDDKMICAFDGTDVAKYCHVPITTMDSDKSAIGELAMAKLISLIENNEDEKSVELPMTLVVRNSTK